MKDENKTTTEKFKKLLKLKGPNFVIQRLFEELNPLIKKITTSRLCRKNCPDPIAHRGGVIQNTYRNALQDLTKFYNGLKHQEYTNPRNWLQIIAINATNKHLKDEITMNNRVISLDSFVGSDSQWEDLFDGLIFEQKSIQKIQELENPQFQLEIKEFRKNIGRIIKKLPLDKQRILILSLQGYKHKEIAAMLQIKEHNSRINLTRINRTVREEYTKKFGGLK